MRRNKGHLLIFLLVAVLLIQVYIMLVRDPVNMSKIGLKEDRILLQGKDPGVPAPIPGKEPEEAGSVQTVQNIGMEARPAVPASHGEGQPVPLSPKTVRPKNPHFPNMPDNFNKAYITVDGSEDYYKTLIYGVLILEDSKELSITKEQALKLTKVLNLKSQIQDAVPEAQTVIMENLTDDQLRYIFLQMSLQRGGSRPLPPEQLAEFATKAYNALQKRTNK